MDLFCSSLVVAVQEGQESHVGTDTFGRFMFMDSILCGTPSDNLGNRSRAVFELISEFVAFLLIPTRPPKGRA